MRTVLADSQDVVAVAMQDHTDPVDLHPLWLAIERRQWQYRCPVLDLQSGTRAIDTDTRPIHQRTTQVTASHGEAVTQCSSGHSTKMAATPTVPPRQRVQRGRHDVQQTMHDPNPARLVMGVL